MSEVTSQNSFKALSSEVVRNFLQTVMVVDDEAYYVADLKAVINSTPPIITEAKKPGRIRVGKPKEETESSQVPSNESMEQKKEATTHRLNAKILTDAFADMGIACTIIRPQDNNEPELKTRVINLAQKSDIIIFDWILPGEANPGGRISEFISEITRDSVERNKKLRLIAVYTGNSDLDTVLKTVFDKLTEDNLSPEKDEEKLKITVGAVHISVFAKQYAEIPEGGRFFDRKLGEDVIPDRLVDDFTEITSGLVSNAALQSFATIRNNTHHILTKFHPALDAPFLAHRLMLPHPSDANEYLATLIGAEITALLEGKKVGEWADKIIEGDQERPFLMMWLRNFQEKNSKWNAEWKEMESEELIEKMYRILSNGRNSEKKIAEELDLYDDNELHLQNITYKFSLQEKSDELDLEFSCLTSLNSFHRGNPALKFGTLLKFTPAAGKPNYRLCVQPSCNCIRIKGTRSFPFLKLSKSKSPENFDVAFPKGDTVGKNESKYIKASISYKIHDSLLTTFQAGKSETVESIFDGEKFIFTDSEGGSYQWMGELKFAHAQRVAHNYATESSRVGLDESEWQRRWSTKKNVKRKPVETQMEASLPARGEEEAVESVIPSEES